MTGDGALLMLGRLDGRLTHSPARTAWLIRARLEGAAISCGNAGVPTTSDDLEQWIAGTGQPPRTSEGLNDPLGIAAIVHFFFDTVEAGTAREDQTVRRLLASLFDSQAQGEAWAGADVVRYGPLWRSLRKLADEPGLEPTLTAVGARLMQMGRLATKAQASAQILVAFQDGHDIRFTRDEPRCWLLTMMVPLLLHRAGLTVNLLPSLVPKQRLLCASAAEWAEVVSVCIAAEASLALKTLSANERRILGVQDKYQRTARSRLAQAAELKVALPSLSRKKLAIALNATPAGAGYLQRQLALELKTRT